MSRLARKFAELKRRRKAALVTYFTAGDPSLELTPDIVLALEDAGADIIELGVPFSDPMADGPVIQLSSERSLRAGTTLHKIVDVVSAVRKRSEIPIILFGYYNPFHAYGAEEFSRDAAEAGADGVLVVDLPPEEAGEFKCALDASGLDMVFLLAPTSTRERMELVAGQATGFIYLVSVTGVTGERPDMDYSLEAMVSTIRTYTDLPVGVGFGISNPSQAARVAGFADAVIVGSALVRIIERNGSNKKELLDEVGRFTRRMSEACTKG